jgi:RHS repeat-associated protein
MATTYYYTANSEIIGEHTAGASRLDYLRDALGSVVGTIDQTLTVKSTARLKPYGADLATTGTTPSYGFTGNTGSRRTGRPHTDLYNRARHIGVEEGRWTTVNQLWPSEAAYAYAKVSPTTLVDPFGLKPCAGTTVGFFLEFLSKHEVPLCSSFECYCHVDGILKVNIKLRVTCTGVVSNLIFCPCDIDGYYTAAINYTYTDSCPNCCPNCVHSKPFGWLVGPLIVRYSATVFKEGLGFTERATGHIYLSGSGTHTSGECV